MTDTRIENGIEWFRTGRGDEEDCMFDENGEPHPYLVRALRDGLEMQIPGAVLRDSTVRAALAGALRAWSGHPAAHLDAVRRERGREALDKSVFDFVRDIATNYDHDEYAHRYGHQDSQCRVCKAVALLAELRSAAGGAVGVGE